MDNVTRTERDTLIQQDDGTCAMDQYVSNETEMSPLIFDLCLPDDQHALHDFLRRPVKLDSGTWSSTTARGGILENLNFPSALLGTPASSSFQVVQNTNKLDGFVGLKARVRIRLEVDSQPFQAGILMLHYVPYADYMQSHTQWYATSTFSDTFAASGCPHVVMNLANTSSVEFVTPYVSPYLYFNLATGQGSFGNVVISVISPLTSAAANTAPYTLWANFEDIELRYPTDAPITTVFAQVGNEIAKMENRGSVSGVVKSIGTAVADVLPYVGLGWLSSPARMLTSAGENILKLLGFSKPIVEAPVTRVKQSPTQYFFNGDGADTSHKLALSANNALATMSGWAGTDHDEMRLDYIVSRPNFAKSFTWSTTQAPNTQLFSIPVSPLYTQTYTPLATGNYAAETRMTLQSKVASMYSLWRGTMVYTFYFAKTQFHSGRIRISFRPYLYDTTIASDARYNNMPAYSYTEEVQLASGCTFTFKVPFVSTRPWMHTHYDPKTSITSGDVRNVATGTLQVAVINQLLAASTVSSSIEVLVFTHMEDAQFAVPVRPFYLPFGIPNVAQMGRASIVRTKEASESMDPERRQISLAPYSTCIGETHSSLRQLLKRFSFLGRAVLSDFAPTTTQQGSSGNGFVIFPWAPVTPQNGTISNTAGVQTPKYVSQFQYGPGAVTRFDTVVDLYSNVYAMYAFFRGSIRYKLVVSIRGPQYNEKAPIYVFINNAITPFPEQYSPVMQVAVAQGAGPSTNLTSGPLQPLYDVPITTSTGTKVGFAYQPGLAEARMTIIPDFEGIIEFEVPYHATGHMCPTSYGYYTATNARSIFYPFPTVTILGSTNANGNLPTLKGCTIDVFRAVGDDFSFGGLLGAPKHALWFSGVDPV